MENTTEIAARLGLRDLFALRRVSDEQLVNLVGVGRGEGWAGNISIDPEREPLVAEALSTGEVVRYHGPPSRIFGPYWADEATVLTVGDFVIVMGGSGVTDGGDDALMEAAGDLAFSVGDVPAEKRLADELEVTKAALAVATLPTSTIDGFLADVADAAMEALGCEFGAVVMKDPEPRLVKAPSGWQPDATDERVLGSLLQLLVGLQVELPVVAQDLRHDSGATSPLGFDEGLVSRCVIPLAVKGMSGAIVVAHTTVSAPRGFTSLCQLVAASIGEQASKVLASSFSEDSVRHASPS
ncbi:MAG: hypothetical protein ACR2QO_03710 [Acidimicrobiales bacterium]